MNIRWYFAIGKNICFGLPLGVIRRIFVLVENGLIFALPIFSWPSRFHSEFSQLRKYIWYLSLSCIPNESRCSKLTITIDKTQSCNHVSLWAWNLLTLHLLHRLEASPSNSLQCSHDLLQPSSINDQCWLSFIGKMIMRLWNILVSFLAVQDWAASRPLSRRSLMKWVVKVWIFASLAFGVERVIL